MARFEQDRSALVARWGAAKQLILITFVLLRPLLFALDGWEFVLVYAPGVTT